MGKTILLVLLGVFIIYVIAYYFDCKRNKSTFKDFFTIPKYIVSLLALHYIINLCINLSIKQDKYLYSFNQKRIEYNLMPLPQNWKRESPLFNNWFSYLQTAKTDYIITLEPDSTKIENTIFFRKKIEIRNRKIAFETDYFKKGNKKISVSYSFEGKIYQCEYYYKNDSSSFINLLQAQDSIKNWNR